jgi:tetratricopeptide (TPR) repeat protein
VPAVIRQFLLLLLAAFARAGTLEEANTLYNSGEYSKAAVAYETMIQSDGPTASRLYNLGNARCRLKEFGPAILAYERALLLAPRDADIRANLKIARDAASANDAVPSQAWWEYPLQWCSLHEWSWITAAGLAGIACAALVWGFAGMRRTAFKPAIIAALTLGVLVTSLGAFAVRHRRGEKMLGIVTAAKPVLRLSPFATAGPAGECPTGRTVQIP